EELRLRLTSLSGEAQESTKSAPYAAETDLPASPLQQAQWSEAAHLVPAAEPPVSFESSFDETPPASETAPQTIAEDAGASSAMQPPEQEIADTSAPSAAQSQEAPAQTPPASASPSGALPAPAALPAGRLRRSFKSFRPAAEPYPE